MITFEELGIKKQQAEIGNKIKLIHYERPNSVTSIVIGFLSGALYQPVNRPGMAHFLEHMIVKESRKYSSLVDIKNIYEKTASYTNAFTGPEYLYMTATIPDENDTFTVLDIFVDQIKNPLLDKDRVSKERNVIKQEISRGQTDLTLVNTWQFNSMMMNKKGNLINPLIGSVNQMDKISRRDLAVFYESLNKQKVYIVSSGPQDIETLSGFFRRMFSDDKVSVRLKNNIINKPEMRAVIKMQEGKDDSIFLKLGARIGVDSYIKDQAAIELLAEYLGGHNGKLLQTLRHEAGLVYAVQVVCYCFNKLGCFYIGTDCSKNDLPLAISRVSDEIYKVKNGNLDNNRLATIKAMLVKRLRRNFEKSEFISMSHIPHAFNPALLDRVAMVNAIGRVTTDDLQRVANEYLNDKNLLWSLAGNIRLDDIDLPGIAKSEVILN